jgi:hypothetical protein
MEVSKHFDILATLHMAKSLWRPLGRTLWAPELLWVAMVKGAINISARNRIQVANPIVILTTEPFWAKYK